MKERKVDFVLLFDKLIHLSNISLSIGGEEFAKLMGHFGQLTNFISLICCLFGTSFFIRRFGVGKVLLLFPTLLLIASPLTLLFFPRSLPILFTTTAIIKVF